MSKFVVCFLVTAVLVVEPHLIAQTEHTTDGEPTALEEEIRWLVNRARFDSAAENALRGTDYTDVAHSAPPLAVHHLITLAGRHHSEDMARNNAFTHDTIAGSSYYDPDTESRFSDRMRAEGYQGSPAGENIAAGYGSAAAAYIGWWNSGGHRRNLMGSNHREIGNGYFTLSNSEYRRYYTMDLGRSGGIYYFTGTLFSDADGDEAYDQDEPVEGVRVSLLVNDSPHSVFDVSAPAGNFAVPIQDLPADQETLVVLSNPTSQPIFLTIPTSHGNSRQLSLGPSSEHLLGVIVATDPATNLGLRQIESHPKVSLAGADTELQLTWPTHSSLEYQAQWTTDFLQWHEVTPDFQRGNGAPLTETIDTSTHPNRFYQVRSRLH